jgi:hypothetical protein
MNVAESLLAEFDRETSLTRKLIERIPSDKLDWRPHPKSTTMGGLGRHLTHKLSVYLRLNDVPVPSIYGPSADEAM